MTEAQWFSLRSSSVDRMRITRNFFMYVEQAIRRLDTTETIL